jgi:hypothetical protein
MDRLEINPDRIWFYVVASCAKTNLIPNKTGLPDGMVLIRCKRVGIWKASFD